MEIKKCDCEEIAKQLARIGNIQALLHSPRPQKTAKSTPKHSEGLKSARRQKDKKFDPKRNYHKAPGNHHKKHPQGTLYVRV